MFLESLNATIAQQTSLKHGYRHVDKMSNVLSTTKEHQTVNSEDWIAAEIRSVSNAENKHRPALSSSNVCVRFVRKVITSLWHQQSRTLL